MLHYQLVKDVAARPAQPRRQGEHKAQQRDMLTVEAAFYQHQHAKDRKANARQLFALQTFAKDKRAENNGKESLHLKHQRSQTRRHTEFDGAKKKRKLTKADGEAVAQQKLQGNLWAGNEQQRREGHQQEAQTPPA